MTTTTTTTIDPREAVLAVLTPYQVGQVLASNDSGYLPSGVRRPSLVTLEKRGLVSLMQRGDGSASPRLTRLGYQVRQRLRRNAD